MNPPPTVNRSHDVQLSIKIQAEILTRHSLPVTTAWIDSFLATIKLPLPPLPALASTAHFRLLSTDFTSTLSKTRIHGQSEACVLPQDITNVQIKSHTLTTNVPVQILDVEDIGSSKWSQIEAIERVERGEEIRGREVIRTVPIMNETDDQSHDEATVPPGAGFQGTANATANTGPAVPPTTSKKSQGPHKVLVQDAAGRQVYAFELVKIPKIFLSNVPDGSDNAICIGAKLLLKKGTIVRRGMVMLQPGDVVVMGGKVDAWDKKWKETRKKRLMDSLQGSINTE